MSKITTLHAHHAFLYSFFAVPAQLRPEMTNFLAELSRAPAEHCGK